MVREQKTPIRSKTASADYYLDAFCKLHELAGEPKSALKDLKTVERRAKTVLSRSMLTSVYEQEIRFDKVIEKLIKLERYERGAFARMIRALRKLDDAKQIS